MTPPRVPTAAYRLQFGRDFTFADAERIVPYLDDLGASHIYASPYLKARAGSTHGYDLTDYNALNPEIGDKASLASLAAALGRREMGQILDFVPNHMGIGMADNAWWLDVLEWGPASPYAEYFDIDWKPAKRDLQNKVLLPFLGDHYGEVLERGELEVAFDMSAGSFAVRYHAHMFPVRPAHYGDILAPHLARLRDGSRPGAARLDELEAMARRAATLRVGRLPVRSRAAVRDRAQQFKRDLAALVAAKPEVRAAVEAAVRDFNGTPGQSRSFLPLHRLLERQSYRLAYWRVAADEINYRRFFDINELAGVRMERKALFVVAHQLILRLIAEGVVHGLRIDHVDGLYDPSQYCRRLAASVAVTGSGFSAMDAPPAQTSPAVYLVVEKILAPHESVRGDWPVDGTTGYEVLNLINGLFVNAEARDKLRDVFWRFAGNPTSFDDVLYACKKHVIGNLLSSELQVLANALDRISESNWRTRDFTLAGLRTALEEIVACFPVYRTYVDDRGPGEGDRRDIDWAVALARRHAAQLEPTIFDFVHAVLTTDLVRRRRSGYSRRATVEFAKHFQQFTGPVMAKSLEDTSFYRFFPLLSLNEVGGDPRRIGITLAAFHHLMQERARNWPGAMTTTATHDTKRGEDARARINVLSEMPGEWGRRVRHWALLNKWAKTDVDGRSIPSRADEFFLYQTMVGSWPNELAVASELDRETLDDFRSRLQACALKAVREAKVHSGWAHPDQQYEDAVRDFAGRILDPERARLFLTEFCGFFAGVAWLGALNGLCQLVLKLTVPGAPDIYQGAELWDYSMVDPDNRRPVDFRRRISLLGELRRRLDGAGAMPPAVLRELLGNWMDGRIKLLMLATLLRLRRDRRGLFQGGTYQPLTASGPNADHLCAFARVAKSESLLVVVPRLMAELTKGPSDPPLGECWTDTSVAVPDGLGAGCWIDVLSGRRHYPSPGASGASLPARDLLADLPAAVLLATGQTGDAADQGRP